VVLEIIDHKQKVFPLILINLY